MTDNKKKKRQYKNKTPGQERDFEILSARRMFQAYEDAPTNSTGPAIANWDPPLGKSTKVMYRKKKRELNMDTLQTDNRVDGRRKNYRETVRRIKERQERLKARDAARIKEPVLKPNPFGHAVAEIAIHTSKEDPEQRAQKDAAISAWKKAGGQVKKIKPSLKGMSKNRKAIVKTRKEEVEMNKKYLDTRPDSLEAAAYQSANTEVPVNPNSLRPTLHLPKNKYLQTKEGSLERAVEEAMVTEAGATKKQVKMATGIANDPRHKGGDMTGAWKKAEKIKKGLGDHAKVQKALRKANEEPESEWAKSKRIDREVSAKLIKTHDEREKRYQAQQAKQKQTREQAVDVINAIQFGKPFKVVDEQEITNADLREKEIGEDDRRTVDAIRAYDKSKDASRDADWDTVHGKIKQGKKEKKYAKKERGEIDKDDPHWKSRAYHTGMHGEETEMNPLIQATMEKIHFMRDDKLSYKERQKLPSGSFALPGKGSGPEGKQGGSYPIPDESHARNALARVSQHGSEAEKAKVRKAVASKFPNIKIGESKETEAGERDVGSDAYADYVAGITPGQEADTGIHKSDAKADSAESKRTAELRRRQATRVDDEYVPTLEEYITHLESLEGEALEAELETLSQNELLEILGTGLVKKAAGAVKKRFSVAGRTAAAQKKGAKIAAKTAMHTQKTSNIAAKAKLKTAKAAHKAAKGPGVVKKAASAVGGAAKKVIGAAPKKPVKVKSVPGQGLVAAEYEPESLIAQAMDELSKK